MKTEKIFIIIFMIICCLPLFVGCDSMKYNNTTDKDILITKEYTISEIENLKRRIEFEIINYDEFQKLFKVQCLRKTCQGYYVVLKQEDQKNVFVFFNSENKLNDILIIDIFKKENEIKEKLTIGLTKNEVLSLDPNTVFLSVSAINMSAHMVEEGIFIVKYSSLEKGNFLQDSIVSSVEFIKNEDILLEDSDVNYIVPLILPIDKQ